MKAIVSQNSKPTLFHHSTGPTGSWDILGDAALRETLPLQWLQMSALFLIQGDTQNQTSFQAKSAILWVPFWGRTYQGCDLLHTWYSHRNPLEQRGHTRRCSCHLCCLCSLSLTLMVPRQLCQAHQFLPLWKVWKRKQSSTAGSCQSAYWQNSFKIPL